MRAVVDTSGRQGGVLPSPAAGDRRTRFQASRRQVRDGKCLAAIPGSRHSFREQNNLPEWRRRLKTDAERWSTRGEAGGGWSGFPPLLATRGRIHKGDGDMRIGAIFARGSCRALKWMVMLGALSVLGSAQAFAQTPMVESATYTATGTAVTLTMSQRVYFDGTDVVRQNLPSAFSLIGGTPAITTTNGGAIQVDIAGALGSASATITLHFATPIKTLAGTGILELTYTPIPNNEIRGPSGVALAVISDGSDIRVTGPDEATKLEIELLPETEAKLEKARLPGTLYDEELPLAEGGLGTVVYTFNTAQLPTDFSLAESEITANASSRTRLMGRCRPLPGTIS